MRCNTIISILFLLAFGFAKAQSYEEGLSSSTQNNLTKIQMYPNPASEYLHVKIESIKTHTLKISIHNVIGNEMPIEIEYMGEHELRIRVKELATGYYLLALQDEKENYRGTYKFLKR